MCTRWELNSRNSRHEDNLTSHRGRRLFYCVIPGIICSTVASALLSHLFKPKSPFASWFPAFCTFARSNERPVPWKRKPVTYSHPCLVWRSRWHDIIWYERATERQLYKLVARPSLTFYMFTARSSLNFELVICMVIAFSPWEKVPWKTKWKYAPLADKAKDYTPYLQVPFFFKNRTHQRKQKFA